MIVCGVLLAAFALGVIGGRLGWQIGYKIEGDTAKDRYYASAIHSPMIHGGEVANRIWDLAKEEPKIKKIEYTIIFSGDTILDQYGNEQPGPYIMGTITVDNLDEVRRYTKEMYWYKHCEYYGYQIMNMRYANCFSGKD